MNKDKIKLLFLFLPLVIVFYFFISNLIISLNADEVLFITRAYDPYDIVMGRYLNVQIENSNDYILKEILGPAQEEGSYEGYFIKWYKDLSETDKNRVREILNELYDIMQKEEALDVDWYNYRDLREFKDLCHELFNMGQDLDNDYELRNILTKMKICYEQKEDYLDIIEEINFIEQDRSSVGKYYENLRDKKLYIPYEIDEDGYAELQRPTFEKPNYTKNYIIEDLSVPAYDDSWVKIISINGSAKRFYIDERLATKAETAIRDARSDGKEVTILCKNLNGTMQIKQLFIDGIDLYDYLEK